jgi:hypothetical protein
MEAWGPSSCFPFLGTHSISQLMSISKTTPYQTWRYSPRYWPTGGRKTPLYYHLIFPVSSFLGQNSPYETLVHLGAGATAELASSVIHTPLEVLVGTHHHLSGTSCISHHSCDLFEGHQMPAATGQQPIKDDRGYIPYSYFERCSFPVQSNHRFHGYGKGPD